MPRDRRRALALAVLGAAFVGCGGDGEGDRGVADAGGRDGGAPDAGTAPDAGLDGGEAPLARRVFLKASNTDEGDRFGQAVAVSAEWVVVGATEEASDARDVGGDPDNDRLMSAGAAYVFRREGAGLRFDAYVKARNPGENDQFGQPVAVDGDLLAVAAPPEDSAARGVDGDPFDDDAPNSGAVYLYRHGPGGWAPEAYLKASNADPADGFGIGLAASGDVVVVGAPSEDAPDGSDPASNAGRQVGAVYVFRRTGGVWAEEAYLKAGVSDDDDRFGSAVDVEGDVLVVGAPGEDGAVGGVDGDPTNDAAESAGAAYVFRRSGGAWAQEAVLKSDNPRFIDSFGSSVAVSGDRIVVGAPLETGSGAGVNPTDDDLGGSAGAAYVFERGPTGWSQVAYLRASNPDPGDGFGSRCDVEGVWVACGALLEDSSGPGTAPDPDDDGTEGAGAVYAYRRAPTGWRFESFLKADAPLDQGRFGNSVALSPELLVVGHPGDASASTGVDGDPLDVGALDSGAAYVFPLASLGD